MGRALVAAFAAPGVDQVEPGRGPLRPGKGELEGFGPAVEQEEEGVVCHRQALGVDGVERITVEIDADRLGSFLP